jgi:hypothetical protein
MGTLVGAHCSGCGYKDRLRLGGGRKSHLTYNAVPVICHLCRQLTTPNSKAEALVCTACGCKAVTRYEVPDDEVDPQQPDVASHYNGNRRWVLLAGPHRCPRCDARELRFAWNGLWG